MFQNTQKKLRPCLREFVNRLLSYYELIVFTSYFKDYADQIINFYWKWTKIFFDYRLYRQKSNYLNEKYYYKNIKKIGRDYNRTNYW